MQVHIRIIEKEIYQTLKIVPNGTGVFCRKERWQEVYGAELSLFK